MYNKPLKIGSCGSSIINKKTTTKKLSLHRREANCIIRSLWPYSEITCKEKDVSRAYISPFNNAAVPALTSPAKAGCCVAVLLLSTQLKPFPRKRQCVQHCLNQEMLAAQTVCEDVPRGTQCLETKSLEVADHHKVSQKQGK